MASELRIGYSLEKAGRDHEKVWFRPQLEVRFRKALPHLQLTATQLGITHYQSRHRLGCGHPTLTHQTIRLPFLQLLPNFSTEYPTHDRVL